MRRSRDSEHDNIVQINMMYINVLIAFFLKYDCKVTKKKLKKQSSTKSMKSEELKIDEITTKLMSLRTNEEFRVLKQSSRKLISGLKGTDNIAV